MKEQYSRLQDDFKSKLTEVAGLRADNEKLKETTKAAEEIKKRAEEKLKELELELKKFKSQNKKVIDNAFLPDNVDNVSNKKNRCSMFLENLFDFPENPSPPLLSKMGVILYFIFLIWANRIFLISTFKIASEKVRNFWISFLYISFN